MFVGSSIFENDGSQLYALGSPLEVEVESMELSSEKVRPGENIVVSLKVKNLSKLEGDYAIRLRISPFSGAGLNNLTKWTWVKARNIHLEPKETKTVVFELSFDKEGRYEIYSPHLAEYKNYKVFEVNSETN